MVTQAIDTLLCFITEFFIFSTNSILHLSAKCTNGVIKPAIALLLVTSLYSTHRVDILFSCSGELYFQIIPNQAGKKLFPHLGNPFLPFMKINSQTHSQPFHYINQNQCVMGQFFLPQNQASPDIVLPMFVQPNIHCIGS